MSASIHVLPEAAIAKIAAGEVVERPAAALKELIENALDAGARRVEIRLAGGGVDRLEVVDDGEGMPPEALPLALTRHATSKIHSAEDLVSVATYGFRGEALPAIAAAAGRMTLASAPPGAAGAEVVVVDGRPGPVVPAAQPPGTRVVVEALFARLPARRAFLRSPQAEAAACHDVVLRAALAAPAVALRLRGERGEVFASDGRGDRADVLVRAYGSALRAALLGVDHREGGVHVHGYVADPAVSRSTRAGQTFLVRGRPVGGRSLTYAAESAFAGRLPRGRFPVFVLAVDLDGAAVDVNVHPQKREVRFADERLVAAAVHAAVRRALAEGGRPAWAAGVGRTGTGGAGGGGGGLAGGVRRDAPTDGGRDAALPASPTAADAEAGQWLAGAPWVAPVRARAAIAGEGRDPWPTPAAAAAPAREGDGDGRTAPPSPPVLVPVRQVRLLYILAEASDGLYVVDQHAAHERVRYEALAADEAAGRPPARQRLLAPLIVDLAPGLVEVLVERQDEVAAAGFVAEPFGAASVRVREVPADLRLPGQVLRDLLAELADPSDRAPAAHRRRALLACRSAVRAGDALAPAEMARILEELGRCREGATCPHGRPTVRRLGWDEIAAWFRRRA